MPRKYEVDSIIRPSMIFAQNEQGNFQEVVVVDPRQVSGQINQKSYDRLIATQLKIDIAGFPRPARREPQGYPAHPGIAPGQATSTGGAPSSWRSSELLEKGFQPEDRRRDQVHRRPGQGQRIRGQQEEPGHRIAGDRSDQEQGGEPVVREQAEALRDQVRRPEPGDEDRSGNGSTVSKASRKRCLSRSRKGPRPSACFSIRARSSRTCGTPTTWRGRLNTERDGSGRL